MSNTLGPYTAGEVPAPLTVTFTDSNGDPINLDGYVARWVFTRDDAAPVIRNAVVADDPDLGQVTYTWVDSDLDEPGGYLAEMWVGDGTNRLASERYVFDVVEAIAVPDI